MVLPSSVTRKKYVEFPETRKEPWRGPDPSGAWKGVDSVRRLVVELMLKTRTRSAPRSGTTMKESVGSTSASWGWGASCLSGTAPG
jgi:hypothetical protein